MMEACALECALETEISASAVTALGAHCPCYGLGVSSIATMGLPLRPFSISASAGLQ